jgi:hypothetical protein
LSWRAQQSQVLRCPNCRAVIVEDEDGIHLFVAAIEPPRLYVDRSDHDALGGFGLQSPRTRSETADQHLILEPALTIVAYDDAGCSAKAHVETWVDEDDNPDPHRFGSPRRRKMALPPRSGRARRSRIRRILFDVGTSANEDAGIRICRR